MMKKYPQLMKPLFVADLKVLTAGMLMSDTALLTML